MSWVITSLAKLINDSTYQDVEAEAIKLSSDINFYQMQESNKLMKIDREYTDENELIEEKYKGQLDGLDSTSSEYTSVSQQKLEEQRKNDNDHAAQTQAIQNETDRKINPLETRKEMIEARAKNARAQYESFKEATDKNVEEECAYFSGN